MDPGIVEGLHLFNTQKFFEAHEALEAVWLKTQGNEKIFLQGVIQVAAAFHHYTRQNLEGARSLLEEGWKKLTRFGKAKKGIDLAVLRLELQPWRDFLDRVRPVEPAQAPPLPRIERSSPR